MWLLGAVISCLPSLDGASGTAANHRRLGVALGGAGEDPPGGIATARKQLRSMKSPL